MWNVLDYLKCLDILLGKLEYKHIYLEFEY